MIADSLDLLIRWRHLYNGVFEIDENGNKQIYSYSLNEAALMLGMSKKSLDDYLLQVRHGLKKGFNFKENLLKSVGTLRSFNKMTKIKPND